MRPVESKENRNPSEARPVTCTALSAMFPGLHTPMSDSVGNSSQETKYSVQNGQRVWRAPRNVKIRR